MADIPRVYDREVVARLEEGAIVGPYRIGRRIGSGGMADVFEATDERSSVGVALKVLHARCAANSEAVSRFTREARALESLEHANIVRVLGHGMTDDGQPWIAMERLRGVALAALIRDEERLAPERALRFVVDAANALALVHERGLVHRDIKPENLFVVHPDTPQEHCKLIDFGVARVTESLMGEYSYRYTRAGSLLGSPGFMAPELLSGKETDSRADIFALGVTLYECLTGKLPFDASGLGGMKAMVPLDKRVRQADPFPEVLVTLIARFLRFDPTERPANGLEALTELRACQAAMGNRIPESAPQRSAEGTEGLGASNEATSRSSAGTRSVAVVVALVVAVVVGGVLLLLLSRR